MERHIYPFSGIVGQDQMRKALIFNAIDPAIGGVLIRGEKGTAKSTAVRGQPGGPLARLCPARGGRVFPRHGGPRHHPGRESAG
ncbi:MAG: hypothetical protein ACREKF_14940, partial [Candidatus Methylomirabilales bacterium]